MRGALAILVALAGFLGAACLATAFFGAAFFGAAFFGAAFLGAAFLATAFFGAAFFGADFFGVTFLVAAFLGAAFLAVTFLAALAGALRLFAAALALVVLVVRGMAIFPYGNCNATEFAAPRVWLPRGPKSEGGETTRLPLCAPPFLCSISPCYHALLAVARMLRLR
jgi:hypothetical protein